MHRSMYFKRVYEVLNLIRNILYVRVYVCLHVLLYVCVSACVSVCLSMCFYGVVVFFVFFHLCSFSL